MMTISMADANDFVETAMLGDTAYKLHFSWNDTAAKWTVDLRDSTNTDIVRGISVVPNYPLFSQCRRRNGLPRGELMAVVSNQAATANQMIGRADFVSGKATLVYIPEDEVNAIMEAAV